MKWRKREGIVELPRYVGWVKFEKRVNFVKHQKIPDLLHDLNNCGSEIVSELVSYSIFLIMKW